MTHATLETPPLNVAPAMKHWLAGAAERGGIEGASGLDLQRGIVAAAAWDAAMRTFRVSPEKLAHAVAIGLRLPLADFATASPLALRLVPERLARRFHVYPLAESDRELIIATADPHDINAEQTLSFASGRRVVIKIAAPSTITDALAKGYAADHSVEDLLSGTDDEISDTVRVLEELEPEIVAEEEVQAGPVVKLTSLILRNAVLSGASDIHIEPGARRGGVRFRIDGVLRSHMQIAGKALNRVVSRIKVLSKLDISDRLRPQDGRARIEVDGREYDLRVSTVPTREAEKVVIRVLRPDSTRGLDESGIAPAELERVRKLLSNREGIVIVTGPTGSGKTTTLYSALKEIASEEVNVMTVEDPVEYELPGVTQIQVEPKRDLTFASSLRAILRQDPDVIFVGEIRDAETAQVAAQAALTGHLVLATLHTNDAIGAIARLVDLGLDRATIAASMRGAIAQRLVRSVCTECATPVDELTATEAALVKSYGVTPTVRAMGCKACGQTGYRGRLPVNEVVILTPEMSEQIAMNAPAAALTRSAAASGMRNLRDVGVDLAKSGKTTLQELERVLGNAGIQRSNVTHESTILEAIDAPRRVLVVDDDPIIRHLAVAALTEGGFTAESVDDGARALERLAAGENWDLVVTDLDMPIVTGGELLRSIRNSNATAELPVIVLTGSSSNQNSEVELIEAGANDYLRKPLDPPRFIARIRAALRRATGDQFVRVTPQ